MTIEELRRARLAAKQEAMGGIGGYAEAKRKVEMEAEAKVEESLFFDPPADGKMTAEQRQAVLTAKLKELGDYGVKRRTVEESPFFDPPAEIELERSPLDPPPAEAEVPKEEVIHPRTKADKPREELIATAPPLPLERPRATRRIWRRSERRTSNPRASATARRSTSLTRPSRD